MIVSITNQKGGTAKTTTVLNMGAALTMKGKKVLLLDLDPQAGLTQSLGINPESISPTIYNALIGPVSIPSLIMPSPYKNLHLIPANLDLAGAEVELLNEISRESVLDLALKNIKKSYDYIFIDCPPSLGLLTINALTSSDMVIVPVQAEYLSLRALTKLDHLVEMIKQKTNPVIITKYLITMYAKRTLHSQEVAQETKRLYKNVYKTFIPRTVHFADSTTAGKPIIFYHPTSPGATSYVALAKEFLND